VSSTRLKSHPPHDVDWRAAGLHYFAYGHYLRQRFGQRVQKVSIDAGFTCPNVDGTVTTGGCNFCDNRSFSPSRRLPRQQITDQMAEGIRRLKKRYKCKQFIAYFQPATNTYAPVERLETLYRQALDYPDIVGLAIGTRPDCAADDVLDLLQELARDAFVSVEFGVQTMHERSLQWMNRGHDYACFPDVVERSRGRGFEICTHIILGIPGETHAEMMATAREMARLQLDSIKIHNLYAVRKTQLGEDVEAGRVELMGRDEYISTLVDFLELLPPTMLVERISGDAPGDYFIGPSWCLDKQAILQAVKTEFENRNTWQGKKYEAV
jgi:radical SAM protein (TIGR01212 family)